MKATEILKIFQKNIIRRYLVYLLPIIFLFNVGYSLVYQNEMTILKHKFQAKQYEEVGILSFVLNTYFDQVYEDLNIAYHSNDFQDYMTYETDETLEDVIHMFERFMSSKPGYVQLRYIDENGMEVARVDQIEGHIVTVKALQDKSKRYYFKSAMQSSENQMYISNFDLNVEYGEIVFPYQPVIRFAIPVIHNNLNKGILIINIDGKHFLSILDHYQKKESRIISVGIFDRQNFWWFASTDLFEDDLTLTNLQDLYGGTLYANALDKKTGQFEFNGITYILTYLESSPNSHYLFEEDYPFGLLSSYTLRDAIKSSGNILLTNIWIRYFMNLILAFIVWQVTLYFYNKESEQLMIFASGYISLFTYDGVVITDSMGRIIFCNHIYENVFGFTLEEIKQQPNRTWLFKNPETKFSPMVEQNTFWEGHVWDEAKNGTLICKHLRVKAVQNKYGRILYYVGIFSEPTLDTSNILFEKRFLESQLYLKSEGVTLESIMTDFFANISRIAVFAFKISGLEYIKYVLNQEDISVISRVVSEQLYESLNDKCKIAFITEDLIVIVTQLDFQENAVINMIDKIDTAFYNLRISESSEENISYLAGVSFSPDHGENMAQLINNAFVALESISKIKMAGYLIFDSHLFEIANREIQINEDIDKAFREHEFYVVYQMQTRFDTGLSIGVEALIRWYNDRLGYLLPKEFIPIIEETKYVKSIAKYVIGEINKEFASLKPYLPEGFRISVNLTEPEFMDEKIINELMDTIREGVLGNAYFCFEITESILIENLDQADVIIDKLHRNGIKIAIDDFGTGYSSLSYLKSLKADKLKVDRIFIQDYPHNDDGAMLKGIMRMTEELEIDTIIEGVETFEQYDICRQFGYSEYQGYYNSKPVAISEIRKIFLETK